MKQHIVNIAGYKFVQLQDLASLKAALLDYCQQLQLKGTILLSPEGINQFLAGEAANIDAYIDYLAGFPAFADINFHRSYSDYLPFGRMLVKVKQKIIPTDVPGIDPETFPAKRMSPQELRQWLREQRDFTLLDTRNAFEYDIGTFTGAQHLDIANFKSFAAELTQLDTEQRQKPVVIFCTGGIRCEKAAPMMAQQGFTDVYQLEGGILNYFQQCGGEAYHGDCFVFDERFAVDATLQPLNSAK